MYRYQRKLLEGEAVYIAGPECFYTYGYDVLAAMRKRAESMGLKVTLPNDNPLDMENPDKQKRADSIFADLDEDIKKTTVIISDLEAYRGAEPDSGTVYEIGMAYAKGARSYGYTRDKRSLASKNQGAVLKDGVLYDERGNCMPYAELPFAPAILGSTKIIEGDFDDCLKMFLTDLEEECKLKIGRNQLVNHATAITERDCKRPLIYLAGFERYDTDGKETFEKMKELCRSYGYEAVSPLDQAPGVRKVVTDNPYEWAANVFDNYQQHVRNCDIIIANLNDYRGYEVNNDVGFECGMGYWLGKKLYGYMDDTNHSLKKIPHLGKENAYRDHTGSNVEDFDYPANLMFACSMKIMEGSFEAVMEDIAKDLDQDRDSACD